MRFFWTEEADRQYLKHYSDREARRAFDDLLGFIEDDPTRGSEIRLIELSATNGNAARRRPFAES